MRKSHLGPSDHDQSERVARQQSRVPQPRRRRLVLDAENAKLRAQVGLRISWIH